MTSSITVTRESGYTDRLRAYTILVDDIEIGRIRDGETCSFPLASGHHQIRLKIDWCGSETLSFELPSGGCAMFSCGSPLRGPALVLALLYVLFRRNQYIWLRHGRHT
jgi:hypothetical protein